MEELKVIQGDTLSCILTIEKPEDFTISRVIFNCPSLNINKDLIPSNDCEETWGLVLNANETIDLWIGRWGFDITAITPSEQVYTIVHNGQFIVEQKRDRKVGPQPIPPGVITGIGWTED